MLIDTHCHLQSCNYNNIDEIIKNALANNVKLLIVNGYDRITNKEAIELSKKYECVYAAVGYGPSECKITREADLILLEEQLKEEKVVAVGEIGIDYHWYNDAKKEQISLFEKQIKIAKKYNKPIIVHCRDAIDDVYNILKQQDVSLIRGIMHCYSSDVGMAIKLIELGMFIGIGGTCTFKNTNINDVIKDVGIEYIVLETDSPYLTPEPYRGIKNSPEYIKLIAIKIAEIKKLDYEVVSKITTNNALVIFELSI